MGRRKEVSSTERARYLARGKHIFNVTQDILVAMDDLGVSKSELAKRLGKQNARISKLLNGSSNMTIGTLAEVIHALGLTPEKTFQEYRRDREQIGTEVHSGAPPVIKFDRWVMNEGGLVAEQSVGGFKARRALRVANDSRVHSDPPRHWSKVNHA